MRAWLQHFLKMTLGNMQAGGGANVTGVLGLAGLGLAAGAAAVACSRARGLDLFLVTRSPNRASEQRATIEESKSSGSQYLLGSGSAKQPKMQGNALSARRREYVKALETEARSAAECLDRCIFSLGMLHRLCLRALSF